jgi:hypothetical protein
MFTSTGLPIPSNEIQTKKRQLINSNNKIIDPTMNEHILDIIQQQIRQLKQAFDTIKQKEQPSIIDLPDDSKEVNFQNQFLILFSSDLDYQTTFIINHKT